VAIAAARTRRFRSVIFDFDEALLVSAAAWRYTIEEAVASVTGRRVDAAPLAEDYRRRPWRQALSVVLDDSDEVRRCEELCPEIMARSAMKRLTLHEGLGMALDRLRGARIELGAISREPHAIALPQAQSTGLDRFLTVLASTAACDPWDARARLGQCLSFLGYEPAQCLFVSPDARDREEARSAGFHAWPAAWVCNARPAGSGPSTPSALCEAIVNWTSGKAR
jgi:phosphoglycolate phosphatase-like HAD superfamily hydrolase